MSAVGANFIESRDENVTLNYNQFNVNTNPLALPGPSLNGRNFFTFPRTITYASTPAQASGGAGADVIALWTGATINGDTFTDATFNPQLGGPNGYWVISNAPTNTAFNMPPGGLFCLELRVLLSVAVSAGNTASCRIDQSINSGGAWIPQAQDTITQSANANPPAVTYVVTQHWVYITPGSASTNWFRFVAGANYVTNFTFQLTVTRFA